MYLYKVSTIILASVKFVKSVMKYFTDLSKECCVNFEKCFVNVHCQAASVTENNCTLSNFSII